jgi:hypothetical protein
VILQHSVRFQPSLDYGPFVLNRLVKQGDNALSFYRRP